MGEDDGGMQWFQQAGLEQNFQEIFGHREVRNYEASRFNRKEVRKANGNFTNKKAEQEGLSLPVRMRESGDKPF